MKTIKTTTVTKETQFVDSIKCDICGDVTKHTHYMDGDVGNWHNEPAYSFSAVEIKSEEGYSYSEGGASTEVSCDICYNCFINVVKPTLEKLGAKFIAKEIDC